MASIAAAVFCTLWPDVTVCSEAAPSRWELEYGTSSSWEPMIE